MNCAVDFIYLNIKMFQPYFITGEHCAVTHEHCTECVKNCQSLTMQFVIKQLRAHIASALR